MIIRKTLNYRIIIRYVWKRMTLLILVSASVSILYKEHGILLGFSELPASILGIALAILIGFRVNSAYERWWEAIKIWGGIINNSRSLGRQVISFVSTKYNNIDSKEQDNLKRELIYRIISYS